MDLRKRLFEKIREQQFAVPEYAPVFFRNGQFVQRATSTKIPDGGSPAAVGSPTSTNACNELVWKIMDTCRDQLQELANESDQSRSGWSPLFQREYTARWNTALWPVLDVAIMLNTTFNFNTPTRRGQGNDDDYPLRREIQQLLVAADETTPVRRYPYFHQFSANSELTGLLYQHYLSAADQLGQLGSMIQSGSLVEDQLKYVLKEYRTAANTFTTQTVPHLLNSEAIRVRAFEQQRHASAVENQQLPQSRAQSPVSDGSSSSKIASSKISDRLNEFRELLDWCFCLVGTLLNKTIEMLNQTFLYAETNRYFAVMHAEMQGILPQAAMALCRFVLWVSTQPPMIMVTKTEFTCHCVLLNNYFTHTDHLHTQIVAEPTAHEIQQKCFLKHTTLVAMNSDQNFTSAGVLVMKRFDPFATVSPAALSSALSVRRTLSTCGKRRRRSRVHPPSTPSSAAPSPPSSASASADDDSYLFTDTLSKSDNYQAQNGTLLSQERLDIGWRFDQTNRMVIAEIEQACCTDRNLMCDTLTSGTQANSGDRQRDIYYLHCWTKLAIFGTLYNVHTLSLPFVIPTRKNQDLQLHRMLKSYSATIFWLHVAGQQDGFIIGWSDHMTWAQFSSALNVYFMREARVGRGLSDFDFMLLKEKAKCSDCNADGEGILQPDKLAYQNIICPHLFYQCGDRPLLKHSLWRALLDLIQLFQNERTKVRDMWERGILGGLWSMDSVTKILSRHTRPVLMSRISLLSGGSIVLSFLSGNVNAMGMEMPIVHTEPLDQQQLSRRNLIDCIADISESEGVEYVIDHNLHPIPVSALPTSETNVGARPLIYVKANSDQLGCPSAHRQYVFHPLKLSIVACRGAQNGGRYPTLAVDNDRQIKTEVYGGNGTNSLAIKNGNDVKKFQGELSELLFRHGYAYADIDNLCQKLREDRI